MPGEFQTWTEETGRLQFTTALGQASRVLVLQMNKGSEGEMACPRPHSFEWQRPDSDLVLSVCARLCSGAAGARGHGLSWVGVISLRSKELGPQCPLQAVLTEGGA